MNITLKILLHSEVIETVSWTVGVHRIGRSEFCDLVLDNDTISRTQLEIRVTESSVYVTNMSYVGKLKLNGEIIETAEMRDGDILSVGPYELLMTYGQASLGNASSEPSPIFPKEPLQEDNWNHDPQSPASHKPNEVAFDIPENPLQQEPPNVQPDVVLASEGTLALRAETLIESKPIVAKLLFTAGPKSGVELSLDAFEVTFGRSKKADIHIEDAKLSRVHAKITRVGLGFRLIDLSSRHGTFVNGVRILEHPLSSFDVIHLGESKIQFLIQDMAIAGLQRPFGGPMVPLSETKSLQLVVNPDEFSQYIKVDRQYHRPLNPPSASRMEPPTAKRKSPLVLALTIVGVVSLSWWLLYAPPRTTAEAPKAPVAAPPEIRLPPNIPRDFAELSAENQRAVEGYYNSALKAADKSNWEEALWNMTRLRELVPYYKQSIELTQSYTKRFQEKQLEESHKRATQNEQADLSRYLQEGVDYLREGSFELAADAFSQAITIDPTSETAKKGLRASEYKIKDIALLPPERDPEKEKKKEIADLFQTALTALTNKSYQEAIIAGEKIRAIELRADTRYLNDAKIIIDRARLLQKEEFEPFLIQAKEKFAEGDYNASRDLCEEMLKRDPAYTEAHECSLKAKRQLNRLAKENYTTGYVLESMNRIEEAKQYWTRARNFVRPGDPYYEKITKKLDEYQ